jgi:pyruvate dehydrogenase E2 component (dihydrolipoamide acetyltransferase)
MTATAVLHRLGGDGPPVLMVHGFGADRLGWAANAHALMGTHTVWAVDLPGHGAAGNDVGDGAPATLAAAVAEATRDLPGPVPVLGHSLGGAVALHLAQLVPDRTGPLVLIAPATVGPPPLLYPGTPGFLDRLPSIVSEIDATEVLGLLTDRAALLAPMVPHVLASLSVPGRRAALVTIAQALAAAGPAPAPDRAPTVIWGEADRVLPCPSGPVLGAAPHIIPGAGHLPHVEKAGAVNRLIRAALGAQ